MPDNVGRKYKYFQIRMVVQNYLFPSRLNNIIIKVSFVTHHSRVRLKYNHEQVDRRLLKKIVYLLGVWGTVCGLSKYISTPILL